MREWPPGPGLSGRYPCGCGKGRSLRASCASAAVGPRLDSAVGTSAVCPDPGARRDWARSAVPGAALGARQPIPNERSRAALLSTGRPTRSKRGADRGRSQGGHKWLEAAVDEGVRSTLSLTPRMRRAASSLARAFRDDARAVGAQRARSLALSRPRVARQQGAVSPSRTRRMNASRSLTSQGRRGSPSAQASVMVGVARRCSALSSGGRSRHHALRGFDIFQR